MRGSEMQLYAEASVPASADQERQAEALNAAIRDVLGQSLRPPDRVIAALDGDLASLRVVDLPVGVVKKVAEVLPGELEAMLPFDLDESVVDYQIVDRDDTTLHVMAVAAPRKHVAKRLKDLAAAGVDPLELGVGATVFEGLSELLPESMQAETLLIIDIGANSTDFCVLDGGKCVFARTVSGGLDLVEGGRREQLGAALQRTLAAYRAHREDKPPSRIMLAGEAAPLEGARSWISERLGLECGVVPLPSIEDSDEETLPTYARAAALAARSASRGKRLDLRKGEFASTAAVGHIREQLHLIAICLGAVLLAFGVSLFARYRVASAEHDALAAKLTEVSTSLLGTQTSSATQARELLAQGHGTEDPLPRFDAYDVLEAISQSIPAEVTHDTQNLLIEIDDQGERGRAEIRGTVSSIADRDRIVEEIEKHHCFPETKKGATSTERDDRKSYKLTVAVLCEDASAEEEGKSRGVQ